MSILSPRSDCAAFRCAVAGHGRGVEVVIGVGRVVLVDSGLMDEIWCSVGWIVLDLVDGDLLMNLQVCTYKWRPIFVVR